GIGRARWARRICRQRSAVGDVYCDARVKLRQSRLPPRKPGNAAKKMRGHQGRVEQEERVMTVAVAGATLVPWWREPTKDQWRAWIAAWLGWTLDSFDFTIFLLIMLPISQEFGVPLTEVTAVFTITLWMRLVGAVSSGWLGDRLGRRLPLMISMLGYSLCNLLAGFSQTFWFLLLFSCL